MTVLIGLLAFVAVALVGWAIAEGKDKVLGYRNSAAEEEALQRTRDAQRQNGYAELGISDVVRTISTKGFSA